MTGRPAAGPAPPLVPKQQSFQLLLKHPVAMPHSESQDMYPLEHRACLTSDVLGGCHSVFSQQCAIVRARSS